MIGKIVFGYITRAHVIIYIAISFSSSLLSILEVTIVNQNSSTTEDSDNLLGFIAGNATEASLFPPRFTAPRL